MEVNGDLHGAQWRPPWSLTDLHGDLHGASMDTSMEPPRNLHGPPRSPSRSLHGPPWSLHGPPQSLHGDLHGGPISMETSAEPPWSLHGPPRRSVEALFAFSCVRLWSPTQNKPVGVILDLNLTFPSFGKFSKVIKKIESRTSL